MRICELFAKFLNVFKSENYTFNYTIWLVDVNECNISDIHNKLNTRFDGPYRKVFLEQKGNMLDIKITGKGDYNESTMISAIMNIVGDNNIRWEPLMLDK